MIKKDNKKATGLMEAISNGLLTKEKMMDNMKDAFQLGDDNSPKNFTFSDMLKAGFGRKVQPLREKTLDEKFENGDVNGTMLKLDDDETNALTSPTHIKLGINAWMNTARRKLIKKKQ
jgi:hypothetical protein